MKKNKLPTGWSEARVRRVLARYESQTDAEAVAEDGAAFGASRTTTMRVPRELVPLVRELIARRTRPAKGRSRDGRAKKVGSAAHAKTSTKKLRTLGDLAKWASERSWERRTRS